MLIHSLAMGPSKHCALWVNCDNEKIACQMDCNVCVRLNFERKCGIGPSDGPRFYILVSADLIFERGGQGCQSLLGTEYQNGKYIQKIRNEQIYNE
jgi:hypothetical protein